MSGADWLVVLGLAAALILGWLIDELRMMDRREIERQQEADSMRRLRREIRRHP